MEEGSGDEKKEEVKNERIVRFIVWHHFHPKIIKKYAFNKTTKQYSYNNVKVIPTYFVKNIVQHNQMPNGYINIDKQGDGSGYYFVPSYTSTIARMDLDQATKDVKSKSVIDNVMSANVSWTCQQQTNNEKDTPNVRNLFHHFQDLCDWAHGRANMYLPLKIPAKNSDSFQSFTTC